jgi:hypothetical protein
MAVQKIENPRRNVRVFLLGKKFLFASGLTMGWRGDSRGMLYEGWE